MLSEPKGCPETNSNPQVIHILPLRTLNVSPISLHSIKKKKQTASTKPFSQLKLLTNNAIQDSGIARIKLHLSLFSEPLVVLAL